MTDSLLRRRVRGQHAEVTSVELFFDLAFVFAITQVSHSLIEHLTLIGGIQAAILLLAVWWAWVQTAWITNWLHPDRPLVRLMLFSLMGVGLVMSSALPDAFGQRGLAFAGAYVAFQLGRTLFTLWATRHDQSLRRNFTRVAIWHAGVGLLWISGGLAEGYSRLAIWSLALAIDYASVAVAFWLPRLGPTDTHDWNIDGTHIAHRVGLFIIVCLGESILLTGANFAGTAWTPGAVMAFALALVGSVAMWWIYFARHAQAASDAISRSDNPGRVARVAYTFIPALMVAGIVVSAAGDELILAHPHGEANVATTSVLIGGPALFLLGALLFKISVFGVWSPSRIGGFALMVFLLPLSRGMEPVALAGACVGILVLVAVWEALWLRRRERQPAAAQVE